MEEGRRKTVAVSEECTISGRPFEKGITASNVECEK
jgi:hypothetical protein